MKSSVKILIVLFLLFSNVSLVYATTVASVYIALENNREYDTLVHGESTKAYIDIANQNTFCSITCDLYRDGSGSTLGTISAGDSTRYSYSIIAPMKGTDTITSQAKVVCSESGSTFCNSDPKIDTKTLSIQVDLTPAEKQAKSFLQNVLNSNFGLLSDADTAANRLSTQLSGITRNVKVGNIPQRLSSEKNSLSNFRSELEQIEALYNDEDYLLAKSRFRQGIGSDISSIETRISSLQKELEEIVRKHNEAAKSVEELKNAIEPLSKTAVFIGKQAEFDALLAQYQSLTNRFNDGLFSTYEEIFRDVNKINSEIRTKSELWKQDVLSLFDKGKGIVNKEYTTLCSVKRVCNVQPLAPAFTGNYQSLLSVCEQIQSNLRNDFVQANKRDWDTYEEGMIEINKKNAAVNEENSDIEQQNEHLQEENVRISSQNEQIQKLNTLIIEIKKLSKKNYITDADLNSCSEQIGLLEKPEFDVRATHLENSILVCEQVLSNVNTIIVDKEKSMFFKFKRFFSFIVPYRGPSLVELLTLELHGLIPKKPLVAQELPKPENIEFLQETKDFSARYCGVDLSKLPSIRVAAAQATLIDPQTVRKSEIKAQLEEHKGQCCIFGQCKPCCAGDECKNDPSTFPVILIHGHSTFYSKSVENSLGTFAAYQQLFENEGFMDQGIVLPDSNQNAVPAEEWGKFGQPITVRTTYYLGVFDEQGNMVGDPKSQSIDSYAANLKKAIELIKYRTGKPKVNIIAHSMGGLVTRAYIKNHGGRNSVNKFIMLGTPNHGYYRRDYLLSAFCGIDVLGSRPECEEMHHESVFLLQLNAEETPYNIQYMTIAGNTGGDPQNDGIVRVRSVRLDGAQNLIMKDFDHESLALPYPQISKEVLEFLKQ